MGATSVTGVGPGSAAPYNKGAAEQTIGINHLVGPHIVAAGVTTLAAASGQATVVNIPVASGVYSVQAGVVSSGVFSHANGFLTFTSGKCDMLLAGPVSGTSVSWMVSTVGY